MKSRKKRTFIVMLLIAVLMFSGCGGSAANTASSTNGESTGVAESIQTVDNSQTADYSQSAATTNTIATDIPQAETGEIPVRFDLREVTVNGSGIVPPVRFQNPFGSCWGFAATAAAEISLLGSGLAQEDGYTAETLNLSEKHVAYFAATAVEDPEDPQYGEGKRYSTPKSGAYKLHQGGDVRYATSLYASGIGPNLEERDGLDAGDEEVLVYKGRNGETESRKVTWYDENGNKQQAIRRFCYSNDDDWDIPSKYRFYQSYRLKDSYILPTPAHYDVDEKNYIFTYSYDPQGTAAIKEQLMALRGVSISCYTEVAHPDQIDRTWTYMSDNWAQYVGKFINANHSVCIVGWDDEYPKENFKEGNQPPENGAWLVRNSWGSELNEFPDNGYRHWGIVEEDNKSSGYFWLSYYDQTIDKAESFSFDKSNVGRSYLVDQHDYYPASSIAEFSMGEENKSANVFTADRSAVLSEISVMTFSPGSEVSYEIYLLRKGYENPADGVLVASGGGFKFEYGGYHRISLDNPVPVFRGQCYSIVISHNTQDGKSCFCLVCEEGWPAVVERKNEFEDYVVYDDDFSEEVPAEQEIEQEAEIETSESNADNGTGADVEAEAAEPVTVPDGDKADAGQDFGEDAAEPEEEYVPEEWNSLIVNERESYLLADGEWHDLADKEFRGKIILMDKETNHNTCDNFPIKAYLEEAENPVYPDFADDLMLSTQEPDNTKTLLLKLKGTVEEWDTDHEITWKSSDESVFTVERNPGDEGVAKITAKGNGTAYMILSVEGIGDRVIGVRVDSVDN